MASTAAAGSACAYCGDDLPAYERWVCCTCCPSGPVAPWHSCGPCALQRSIGGTGAAAPPAKRQRTAVDSSTPCFEDGHRFEPVVRPGSGWLTLEPGPEEGKLRRVRRFLREFPLAAAPPSLAWISVCSSREGDDDAAGGRPYMERVAAAQAEWALLQQRGKPTQEAALELGRRHGIRSGKWMLMNLGDGRAEPIWAAVARAVYAEALAPTAKITAGPLGAGQMGRVICCYTSDFNDRERAMAVHAGLAAAVRAALPGRNWSKKWVIHYKPDIMTHLGIYSNRPTNPHRIKSCTYSAAL